MANCGAAGTAIDRASAALGSSTATGKHVSSFLGHVGMANAMPLAPPSQLQQQPQHGMMMQPPQQLKGAPQQLDHRQARLNQAWASQQQQQYAPQQQQQQQAVHHQQQHMMQAPMMQHQMMMQQQQHQMMHTNMMMQQQQHFQQQQAQHQKQIQHQNQQQEQLEDQNIKAVDQKNNITLDNWHDDLEDDLPQGATMDDLAAAWAQAEAEYEHETAVNLASGYINGETSIVEHPYQFQNPLATEQPHDHAKDWMAVGVQEYKRGNLVEAIRAFETLVQLQDDHAKAWYYLGKCHAENDQDVLAIACLERSVERDPFAPETLLALGVSHVNELNHKKALQNLKEWITHNPKYAGLPQNGGLDDLYGVGDGNESELDQVQGLLLRALEHESSPDVQEALGVVYNVSRDYDAAVACFERALQVQPNDYSLWNKLGATLANSNASERALPAYQEALKLRPKYARAWLNMAISHSNLQNYHEAARCYLQTLSLNPSATHCWSYLRIALSCQEQWDLLPLVADQDLKAFRDADYDFVLYE